MLETAENDLPCLNFDKLSKMIFSAWTCRLLQQDLRPPDELVAGCR